MEHLLNICKNPISIGTSSNFLCNISTCTCMKKIIKIENSLLVILLSNHQIFFLFDVDGEGTPAPVRPRPKLNRGLSKTDLKRQLSKQASIINDEKITKAEANERTQLIGAEKVETGTVSYNIC